MPAMASLLTQSFLQALKGQAPQGASLCAAGVLPKVGPSLQLGGSAKLKLSPPLGNKTADKLKALAGGGEGPVWELDAGLFSLINKKSWDAEVASAAVQTAVRGLGVPHRTVVEARLDKLLLIEEGGSYTFDKPAGSFATLLLLLPSYYEGGALAVSHQGQQAGADFSEDAPQGSLRVNDHKNCCAAFYNDCESAQLAPQTSGRRLLLCYRLVHSGGPPPPPAPTPVTSRLLRLVQQWATAPAAAAPAKLCLLLERYNPSALRRLAQDGVEALTHADRKAVQLLLDACQAGARLDVQLACLDVSLIEEHADGELHPLAEHCYDEGDEDCKEELWEFKASGGHVMAGTAPAIGSAQQVPASAVLTDSCFINHPPPDNRFIFNCMVHGDPDDSLYRFFIQPFFMKKAGKKEVSTAPLEESKSRRARTWFHAGLLFWPSKDQLVAASDAGKGPAAKKAKH